jgi:predicted phosphodiesterase
MTRIALVSDIHGNAPALRAFLQELPGLGADQVVNLGDIASGGVDPRGTLDLLRGLPGVITIRGNHERQVLGWAGPMGASDQLAASVLTDEDSEWLAGLPATVEIVPGVLAFHGTPDDDLQYLLHTVTPDGLRDATDEEVVDRLGESYGRYGVFVCGHSHLQRQRRLPDGSLVVNPGSVGWPAYSADTPFPHVVEAGTPDARFTILDSSAGGWRVTERMLPYDTAAAASYAEANSRPDVVRALLTGRV